MATSLRRAPHGAPPAVLGRRWGGLSIFTDRSAGQSEALPILPDVWDDVGLMANPPIEVVPSSERFISRLRAALPQGRSLPDAVWAERHRRILVLLWLHVPGLFVFALVRHQTVLHGLFEAGLVANFPVAAEVFHGRRRLATVIASLGLLTCSAVLVHLSGGVVEAHFHYFVMVGVVTLYQDWLPFLLAIAYVVFQHGVAGAIAPGSVYNHRSAIDHPWTWAGIHGAFIGAMSFAAIASWKLNELLWKATADREAQLSEAQEVARLGSWEYDFATGQLSWSDELYRLFGVDPKTFTPTTEAILDLVHPGDREVLGGGMDAAFNGKVLEDSDFRVPLPDGTDRWLHRRGKVVRYRDGRVVERSSKPQRVDDVTVGRVWSFRDVTDNKRLQAELAHQAFHDSLTALANQALFRDRVDHAVARNDRLTARLAVIFLDLDNFKTVNDSLGHTAGDEVLVAVAERLGRCVRDSDTVARLGGDEFAVLLEDLASVRDVTLLADRLIAVLERPFNLSGREVFIGASIGIALDGPGVDGGQLLRNADIAMYTAKRRGKGRYEIFQAAMHLAAVDRMELEADLRKALERRELSPRYPPVLAPGTAALTGVEAPLRWRHPARGAGPPATFLPFSPADGLIGGAG